jgi:Thoeris protein ThsB, TIR-like domain
MFRRKREDTAISTIERMYCVELHARGDMKLGSILEERGFDSLHQLLDAYHRRLTVHARKRRIFISFHKEDREYVSGFCLMARNPNVAVEFYNESLRETIGSDNMSYVRLRIREMIARTSILVCLVGNGTAWREWVDWELRTAADLHKGICGVRIRESHGRIPPLLHEIRAPIAAWDTLEIVAAIECAAARRS